MPTPVYYVRTRKISFNYCTLYTVLNNNSMNNAFTCIHNAFTCNLYNFYTLILELSCTYTTFKGWTLKKQQHSKKNCMQMWRRKKTFFTLYVKDILFRFPPSLVSTALLYFNNTVLNRTALPPIKINCLRLHPPGI